MVGVINLDLKENQLTQQLMDSFLKIHKIMGPGLLESIYEECLCYELQKRNIHFERQKNIPLQYEEVTLKMPLRIDLVVENQVIIELKSVDNLLSIHEAQLLSYMKLTGLKIGLLVNFNVPLIKQGVKRFVL